MGREDIEWPSSGGESGAGKSMGRGGWVGLCGSGGRAVAGMVSAWEAAIRCRTGKALAGKPPVAPTFPGGSTSAVAATFPVGSTSVVAPMLPVGSTSAVAATFPVRPTSAVAAMRASRQWQPCGRAASGSDAASSNHIGSSGTRAASGSDIASSSHIGSGIALRELSCVDTGP